MPSIAEHMDSVIIKIIKNHGVQILHIGDDNYASFGDRLSVEVSETEASILEQYNEEYA